jgi:hypothetical protein
VSVFTLEEVADLADVKAPQLRLWLETGKFKIEGRVKTDVEQLAGPVYFFNEDDIPRLVAFAATQGKRKPARMILSLTTAFKKTSPWLRSLPCGSTRSTPFKGCLRTKLACK